MPYEPALTFAVKTRLAVAAITATLLFALLSIGGAYGGAVNAATLGATTSPPPSGPPRLDPASDSGLVGDGLTNVTTPRIYGTALPNEQIRLNQGTLVLGYTSTDAAGGWAMSTPLSNGVHPLVAWAIDSQGNVALAPSTQLILIIDPNPPAAPPAPTLDPASDSAPVGDNTTNVTTPLIVGAGAEMNSNINVYVGGAKVGTAPADTNGNWAYRLPTLAVGTRAIYVTDTDMAANTGAASATLSLTIAGANATVPGAPTLNSATAGNGSVSLAWSAPASNGGSAITSYRATASPGGLTCTTSGLGCTVGGLTNGVGYSFTVTATNAVGTGPASNSLSATPVAAATVPGAPTLMSATGGDRAVSLAWSAPASNGGSAISSYRIYRSTASGGETFLTTVGNVTGWTDSGLTNGTTYFYQVSALNGVGEGPRSSERSATPGATATVPGAPTLNSATAGNGSVSLAWSAPASNGGSAITSYRATASPGGLTCTTSGLGCTVSGLTNGTGYSFTVTATNAIGTGPASNALSATPATVPGAPALNSATGGDRSISLAWSAPASNGGSPITGYYIYRGNASGSEALYQIVGNVATWTDTNVSNGTTYYYQVSAYNAQGIGSRSVERFATPAQTILPTPPSAPTLMTAVPGNGVTITWGAPANNGGSPITGYRIYRGTAPAARRS